MEFPRLPLELYFDPAALKRERSTVLRAGHRFLGHRDQLPAPGSYAVPPSDPGRILTRDEDGIHLLSNSCRHRGARMMRGRGAARRLVCPFHTWTYHLDGRLAATPRLSPTPCDALDTWEVQTWRGWLFEGPRRIDEMLAPLDGIFPVDTGGYVLDRVSEEIQPINWKIPIEVFLDDYHVQVIHPGFRTVLDGQKVRRGDGVRVGDGWSAEVVPPPNLDLRPGSDTFARYTTRVLEANDGRPPELAAFWLFVYPNVMIEWYPYMWTVSTYEPLDPERTRIVCETYVRPDLQDKVPGLTEATYAAIHEVQDEDDELIAALHEGRRAMWQRGETFDGAYHPVMETQLVRFHRWLTARLECELA